MTETKQEKLGRLMRDRLEKLRHYAGLIMNLAGPNYEYMQRDVDYLRHELDTIIDETLSVFDKPKKEIE